MFRCSGAQCGPGTLAILSHSKDNTCVSLPEVTRFPSARQAGLTPAPLWDFRLTMFQVFLATFADLPGVEQILL